MEATESNWLKHKLYLLCLELRLDLLRKKYYKFIFIAVVAVILNFKSLCVIILHKMD